MQPVSEPALPSTLAQLDARAFGHTQARHLLWRAGFGGPPDQVQALVAWGLEESVTRLIEYEAVEYESDEGLYDSNIIEPLTPAQRAMYRRARQTQDENTLARLRIERQRRQAADRRQMGDIQRWWLTRMIETPRPLEEKMTLFWHGHFATSYRTIEDSYHMYRQNRLFRAYATENFGQLLYWIIRDPAMLEYLDANESRVGQPNENLARELMELFSLGVGNYTERDVRDGARSLTGYTFEDDTFTYMANRHDNGQKHILNHWGNLDGDDFVTAILEQPACARFMARKLYAYFVADLPERDDDLTTSVRAVVDDLASTMLAARYEIKPVLRRLFLSEHFYHASIMHQQIKSPAQLVVGAVRSLHTPVRDLDTLIDAMNLMGQHLMYPPSVEGWPGGRSWINTSTLFVRQNTLVFLLTGRGPGDMPADREPYDPTVLLAGLAQAGLEADAERTIRYLLRCALGHGAPVGYDAITRFVDAHASSGMTDAVLTGVLLLITAMPEYQLC